MIKKVRRIFQPYMIRPMVYQCGTKLAVALVLCLLWNRFVNREGLLSMVGDAFFVAAAVFVMLAWFQYLRLDQFTLHHLMEERREKKKKKKKAHVTRDIVDFADEKIISFAELEDDERTVCRLLGDLLCAAVFLLPSMAAWFL